MNILLISQCSKRALTETRRIIDQFAERKGERTWQTAITLEGLNTLRRLLQKTARRNTAVACHWIKSSGQTELLWIIGNLRRFNRDGTTPTHFTERDILKSQDENQWQCAQSIGVIAAIAGLFHDFGKASYLFQQNLFGKGKGFQPYRHEWVSLRLFCAWVARRNDVEWLEALASLTVEAENDMLARLIKDPAPANENPFDSLPPVAKCVAWLILSHHRLPVYPKDRSNPPSLAEADGWLTRQLEPVWNAANHLNHSWQSKEFEEQWLFTQGTPFRSQTWRAKAQKIARRALAQPSLLRLATMDQLFTCHMARLVLMLADHHYSSLPATPGWQDRAYQIFANSDETHRSGKQQLDEHTIGVAQNALLLGISLPHLRKTLPAITRHKAFSQRTSVKRFYWQNRAYDLASSLRERTVNQGFFGINMASTGCGKTFGNARIMYALADEKLGCRFSVALGLRTLTLQTGNALRERLKLDDGDLAVMVGSQAVKDLYQHYNQSEPAQKDAGSHSEEPLFYEHQYVRYDGSLDDGRLSRWLSNKPKLNKLLSAPVLISTIDYLIPATEALRGGKQIAPALRLLTADLVLDEPDDFDIADLSALCRLVNWAGMLGSRVLLSSATLPPSLVLALFNAYRHGRTEWHKNVGLTENTPGIICAWFDEEKTAHKDIDSGNLFQEEHDRFVTERVNRLEKAEALRKGELVDVVPTSRRENAVLDALATTFYQSMQQLHAAHHQQQPATGKCVSLGVIRMANIDPLVGVARRLLVIPAPDNTQIHYCVYHSQHPLAMRSHIENRLEAALTRHDEQALWQIAEIKRAIDNSGAQNHIFVVLSTSVIEVGRDFDFDWAIAEPSSIRALVQLAGRIQRHRQKMSSLPNLHLLRKNYRALRSATEPAYCRPGFENKAFPLVSHDLKDLLDKKDYEVINARPRVQEPKSMQPSRSLIDLEHVRLRTELQGRKNEPGNYCAALWWRQPVSWCGELQRRRPFRASSPDQLHFWLIEEEGEEGQFYTTDEGAAGYKKSAIEQVDIIPLAQGVTPWITPDYQQVYVTLADELEMELTEVSQRFGEIRLRKRTDGQRWLFHPLTGVFGALE
ncbi:type I-F CRISPR-associated helicase Cas3f [Pantoea piersonii]|uniref:Type I-F CRISPR-associated helicase Cas3f n=1 Tax=Pantoea piersonii TaxID=2364647 RepID=A0AAJ5U9A3_9GAMM|nr:type I-F CRISPR-associated helicase Cas3f [Pantoea piersonii]WBG90379.1 type I-F CRISPR-associated helicase Cas3f [Pantoea piersonii]